MVIAHHLMLTGYGHWLPNEPRGSMSLTTHSPKLAQLAHTHFGRRKRQPSLEELRAFYRKARPYLAHEVLWFGATGRKVIAEAMDDAIQRERFTCYACAVLTNHVHLLVRKHWLKGEEMSSLFREAAREELTAEGLAPKGHPVFSADVCDHYKSDPEAVRRCARYIEGNFRKHKLPVVKYDFVTPYDGWPFRKRVAPRKKTT